MEVKVFVNGLPRVVCGLTKDTICQEVVIALAQAIGQPGRYTLWEKFKDFQRCMVPSEHVLETLERYGELAKDVQLTLIFNGLAGSDPSSRRFHKCPPPPLWRKDPGGGGGRLQRGSSSLSRQSLPTVTELQAQESKRPRRKSLTIMEEAREWLENLGRGKVYKTTSQKDLCKKSKKTFCKDGTSRNSKVKVNSDKMGRSDLDNQTSCCIRSQLKARESWSTEAKLQAMANLVIEDEKERLIENILSQKSSLEDLKMQIVIVDRQIFDLEERQRKQKAEEEAKQQVMEEELEQIMFWENELMAEEGHERDLQSQFLEMKERVMEARAELEELRVKKQGSELKAGDLFGNVSPNRKSPPRGNCSPPHALVAPSQIKERRPTGPAELREWWARWAQGRETPQNKVIHRTELTIYLKSTKV